MKSIIKKYTDGFFDFVCEGVEFLPQKRTVKYEKSVYDFNGDYIAPSFLATYLDFPYTQFVLLHNTIQDSWAHYLSFSDVSLLDGGKRYILHLPNMDHGVVCLNNTAKTLEEFVSLFWLTRFEHDVEEISKYKKSDGHLFFEFPNLWDDAEPLPLRIQHWKRYE